ncbi:MAG: biotin carboxylase N-terminal domain-containing protein [Aquiluna sp.]|nr:biotin carboxylase N-terminal domain-containing protein [Aquiluna sp.]
MTERKITKVLIANRGEIAVRVIRAAKDSGIQTVAVYADGDRNAQHVKLADEAYALNGETASETYLVVEKILSIAKRSEANAIHPGYGFLSENAEFARAVKDAGIIWIGPEPEAIALLGDKVSARKIAESVGAPLAPGTINPIESVSEVEEFVAMHGLPVAIKAAYGGGGRGIKIVREKAEIAELFESATREAIAAFGRGECFLEKYLEKPRHVETQCLADEHGNVVVVSTRDCSLQRRHQKLVEEAPAPFLTKAQEENLYEASKAILRKVNYTGAGTCEFLIAQDGTISFLEVNTRLQVEHPVSEEVTGIDLVRQQFNIAEGKQLDFGDPEIKGHSFEFRINGEDAGSGFLPSPGPIHQFLAPSGPGVRVDSGVVSGDVISGKFDSMMAKLIVTGKDRNEALARSRRALAEMQVLGLPTVLPFHRAIVEDDAFIGDGKTFKVFTRWIETDWDNKIEPWSGAQEPLAAPEPRHEVVVEVSGKRLAVSVPKRLLVGEIGSAQGHAPKRKSASHSSGHTGAKGNALLAPMQATVVKLAVQAGDHVEEGDLVVVLEAMKMEQPLTAHRAGTVSKVGVEVGATISAGTLLLEIED